MYKETKQALWHAVNQALADIRHSIDLSLDDVRPDAGRWTAVAKELNELGLRAYPRNHNVIDD